VDAGEADVYGGEPVYSDQKVVGVTTPGACGHAVQKSLALAYVNPEFVEPGSAFDIENLGVRCRRMSWLSRSMIPGTSDCDPETGNK
jgi:dimethylglycine dehydrogenase